MQHGIFLPLLPPARVRPLLVGQPQEIVHAGSVKLSQCSYHFQRIVQGTRLILGIGILFDVEHLRNLLLRQIPVDPQISDALIAQWFYSHNKITHAILKYLIFRYCFLSENQIF